MRALAVLCLSLCPVMAWAEPAGDWPAFDACVAEMMADNADNFLAPAVVPALCGDRYVAMRQSCSVVEYMLLESRAECTDRDLAFWQAEVARLEAEALAEGRGGVSGLLAQGLERCADTDGGPGCLLELYWREAMGFQALRPEQRQ